MCSRKTDIKIEKFTDSDVVNVNMLAEESFRSILEQVQSSKLNFYLKLSPFSATISIKKSFIKDENGCQVLPSIVTKPNSEKDVEYNKIRDSQSVFFQDLMDCFEDPKGENRKGIDQKLCR